MGDHAECFQVDYDPAVISFERLLQTFWNNHDPKRRAWSRQYMSAVFFADQSQEKAIKASLPSGTVETEILALSGFTLAEDYHQKYYLQQRSPLVAQMRSLFSDFDSFLHSSAACKANAVVAGHLKGFDLELLGLEDRALR